MKTEVLKISEQLTEIDIIAIKKAAEVIKRGGLVVFPTETVYGLGADATNPAAAERTYKAKGRPSDNPLIIHLSTPRDAERYAYTSDTFYRLADRFMPGPLTVVLKAKESVPKQTRGGLDTVAVRCPENLIARKLIEFSEVAISAPSANISGTPSATSAKHVIDDMIGRVDLIIDGGDSAFGLESTIVKIDADSEITLLRPGKITVDDLLSAVDLVNIADAVTAELKNGELALSPGMKYKHYAPRSPIVLWDGTCENAIEYIKNTSAKKIAILAYREEIDYFSSSITGAYIYDFGLKEDHVSRAHDLFYILRDLDKHDFEMVFAPLPSKTGISLAIYNRMIRAAAHNIIKV